MEETKKEVTFVDGMIVKQGKFSTKVSIKVDEFAEFVKANADKGWVNIEIKTSKNDKMYACLDTWKPDPNYKKPEGLNETDTGESTLPF